MNNDENTYYLYTEFISKNNQHRFKDIHSKNKSVRVYATVGSRKCFVHLLEYYLDKLPPDPKAFYLCPLAIIPDDSSKPWFSNVPVAINTLHNLMKKVSEKGELAGKYTNHSLRATSASRLFAANVPEPCWFRAYKNNRNTTKEVTKVLNNAESENIDPNKQEGVTQVFSGKLDNCVINIYASK